jgi:protoheme ferro-lyase
VKKLWFALAIVILLIVISSTFSTKQDDMNFRKYLHHDKTVSGKPGVLLTALGQPEYYDFEFFDRYMTQIFNSAFPVALKPIIMADKGTVLMDPDNLKASEEFKPQRLIDCFGKEKNEVGEPYIDLEVEWVDPREEDSPGHFLWEEHKNGYIDIVEKVSIKICASYYGNMPGNKIPFMHQHKAIFKDFENLLAKHFPGVPMRWALGMYPETIEEAVDGLIHEKIDTIVVCDFFHVYSSLEEFNSLFEEIKDAVAERAKVVFTPFPGAYASYRKAYVTMAEDEILPLPKEDKKLLILTRHGFPEISGEPYHDLARVFYDNTKKEIENAIAGTNTLVILADTDFAGEDMDPEEKRLATFEALEMGLEDKYDYIIFILVDFMSENTDSIFAHPTESLEPLHFEYEGEVPYYDFDKPYRLELKSGKTRVVSAGCPVGDRYRRHISQGIFDAVATVLRGDPWPELILEEEEKKEALF